MAEIPELLSAGLLLLLLFAGGWLSFKFRFPDVIVYLLLGIAVSGALSGSHLLHFAGEMGIVLLFFMLGIEFPIKQLIGLAKKVYMAGLLDILLSFGVTVAIAVAFQLDWFTSFLVGGVVYATSSSLTAKLLESSKRMVYPEAEFMLGLLIFEDLFSPILVAVLASLAVGSGLTFGTIGWTLFLVLLLIGGAIVIGVFLFRKLWLFVDRYASEDFFMLLVLGISLTYGGLALLLGLSEVLGAFLAGIMLAEVKRGEELHRITIRFRNVLLPLFFVYFGTTIEFGAGIPMIPLMALLFFWSILAKILTGYWGGQLYGLSEKAALRAGFSLTQRGEFSIIIAALAAGSLKTFSSVFILLSAITGVYLFQFAPQFSTWILGKRKRAKIVEESEGG
ncbi:CPA2 family monovalent cation:H+ antiporter-2 [Planomicrobium soli]|uniref:CPA2 family monovalent cation:H+ antiporter-2 n=1 Tax=Planomicrobium soli TaxID=1176648 RepID=A0A2P8H407_9BACL|nr:cation:proton antiporter [Planomicrobium soli]PSL40952.1 CPA2 family monovalent cation:H+ antiporter-2 [Planomicrobium soli]